MTSMQSLARWLPFLDWPKPTFGLLRGEFWAGLTVGLMLLPQGVAYAALAGMPLITGIYASIIPAAVAILFSPSPRLGVGPTALSALLIALIAGRWTFGNPWIAMAYVLLLGIAAFMTVAPMQMRVLQSAGASGTNLASSLNISAFNLGNAIGAWIGGAVIAGGLGLLSLSWAAGALTVIGLLLTAASHRLDQVGTRPAAPSLDTGALCMKTE